jgi:hypothetical protein
MAMKKIFYCLILMLFLPFILKGQENKIYTQTVRGVVYDKNLTTPLADASVIIIGTEPALGVVTDADGKFKIENVPVGRYDIKIAMLSYKPVLLTNQLITSGKETVLEVYMEEDIIEEKELVVKGEKDKSKANNGLITGSVTNLRTEEINRFAGSRSDPSRMASNYAGVSGGGDQRNDIIVRGNSPVGVLWRLEGVDIPNPNHFTSMGSSGGAFSILNNNLLANSDFMTGAFPAEYGNKTAAVFDVKMRNGNNEKRENTFQIGLSGIEFTTEGPISKKSGSSYMASYRFFSFGALEKLGVSIGANGIPQYQDFTMKVNVPTKKLGTFTVWGIMGKSSIDQIYDEENRDTVPDPTVRYESTYYSNMFASGISNEHLYGEKTKGKLTLSASGSKLGYRENDIHQSGYSLTNVEFGSLEGHYLANYTLSHKFNARHFVKGGVIMRNMFYDNRQTYFDYDDSISRTPLDQNGNTWLAQAFIHYHFRVTEKLSLHPGIYYQQFMLNNSKALEPRLAVAYTINEKNSVSIASGLHSQTLPLFIYQSRFRNDMTGEYYQPNKNLDFMRSAHLVASYKRSISKNLRFKTEAYYQYLYDVPVSTGMQDWYRIYSIVNTGASYGIDAGADSSSNSGKGRNYGAEISLEKYFSKGYYFLTNLSLLKSEYRAGDGVWRNSVFDIGHVYNILAGKEFHLDKDNRKVLSVDFKMTWSGGRRYVPIDAEASLAANETKYDFENAYEKKLKDYYRADIKISYAVNRPKATHNLFIAADNVLNTQNILEQYWDKKEQKVKDAYQLGIFPYLGYKIQF